MNNESWGEYPTGRGSTWRTSLDIKEERITEHQGTISIAGVMGIRAKMEMRHYMEVIPSAELKLYNELFYRRTHVINRIEGVITPEGEDAFNKIIEMYRTINSNANNEVFFFVSKRTYWELMYASQGKRYPSPRKRKSQARMSKKWRNKS